MALAYVGRYATTRAKLVAYLSRKLATRGWDGEGAADVGAVADRCVALGYIDDAAFAAMRGAALSRRGYGARRVAQALRAAGVDADDAAPAEQVARDAAMEAAMAYAKRRRLGPFSNSEVADVKSQQRCFAALLRAGHDPEIARCVAYADIMTFLERR